MSGRVDRLSVALTDRYRVKRIAVAPMMCGLTSCTCGAVSAGPRAGSPSFHLAISDFEAAIARGLGFALAWSGLADASDGLARREPESRDLVPRGLAAARRSIALAPELAEAHAPLGPFLAEFEHDYARAEESLRQLDESGRNEVYVRDYPELGGRWQVSAEGGAEPRWGPDGTELFYRQGSAFYTGPLRQPGAGTPL